MFEMGTCIIIIIITGSGQLQQKDRARVHVCFNCCTVRKGKVLDYTHLLDKVEQNSLLAFRNFLWR